MIDLKDVSYSYPDPEVKALNKISLHIGDGESAALMGTNGSGKSTLLKLINGIIFPDSGTYMFDGEEITRKKMQDEKFSKRFHQQIGFVFQDPDAQLFCTSVYDEVAFGPRQMGLGEKEVEERVGDCLEILNIRDFGDRQPYHLSGGEKRKVAIASVLSMNPKVIVLDEPLSGLDPRTQRWLAKFLSELNEAGKTLILSTHDLELVQDISKRTVLFDEGHNIVADRPTEKLLEDIELLKKVNLVDEFYHKHEGSKHAHFHIHNY